MRSSTKGMQMKKNLGKIFLLLILLNITLFAQQRAIYKLTSNKPDAYVKEPIEITFTAKQKEHNNMMFFFVHPKKSDDYTITLLGKETKEDSAHNSIATFTYVLFPIKSKKIDVAFDFYVKSSSARALAQAYIADHDEGKGIKGDITTIPVKPLTINIKALPHAVDLIGDFKLESTIDKKEINQYDNINLHYKLYGEGYLNDISFLKKIPDVEIFSDIQNIPSKLTKYGYKIDKDYTYALSATHSFIVPSIELKAFSPAKEKIYTLKTPGYIIQVNRIDPRTLLDKEESPKEESTLNFKTLKEFFIYIFIFASGYLVAKLTQNKRLVKKRKMKFQDIENANNAKELILTLLNNYKEREIEEFIKELEEIIYNKKDAKFEEIKKRVLREFT